MRILLAYDRSPGARRAADLVARTPWPVGTVVRVVTSPSGIGDPLSSFAAPAEVQAHARRLREAIAIEQAGIAADLTGAGMHAEIAVLAGRPGPAIVREADRFDADLIVAGSGEQGAIAATLLGSVSREIVEEARCSVLVARTDVLERVLLATDGSEAATAAVKSVVEWPMFAGALVRVLGVIEPAATYAAMELSAEEMDTAYAGTDGPGLARTQALVDGVARGLTAAGRAVDIEIRTGDPKEEIVAAAQEWPADLVVLGANAEPLLRRLLLGSVTRSVLHGVVSSALVVRRSADASPAEGDPG